MKRDVQAARPWPIPCFPFCRRSVEHRLEELALFGEFGGIRLLERFEILALPDDGGEFREMGDAEVFGLTA